jgi:protein phosphatase
MANITKAFEDNLSPKLNDKQIFSFLKASIESANAAIYEKASSNEELKGMGTTVVCTLIKDDTCFVAHAGDSRLYLFREGNLSQITNDHSVVQSMVDNGHLTEEEAKIHPNKNIITRALGVHKDVDIDISDFRVNSNDIILLCSDGLTNCVDNAALIELLSNSEFDGLAEVLVNKANDGGGNDNITVVALKI